MFANGLEAFQAWSHKGGKAVSFADARQVEALIDRKIKEALASQLPNLQPTPAPEAEAPPPTAGTKRCKRGHAPYPQAKAECPQCVRERTRAYRKRKATTRRGEVPS
jgi:hypothetical protein